MYTEPTCPICGHQDRDTHRYPDGCGVWVDGRKCGCPHKNTRHR